jgi:hypothetical protein
MKIDILDEIHENQEVLVVGMGLGLLVAGLVILIGAIQLQYVTQLPVPDINGMKTILDPTAPGLMELAGCLLTFALGLILLASVWKKAVPQSEDEPENE